MDHLQEAEGYTKGGDDLPMTDADEQSLCYQAAIAHALIALVERMDNCISVDGFFHVNTEVADSN